MEKLIQMAINLDAGVDQLGSFYVSLNQEIENLGNIQGLSNQMMEHKVTLIRRILGSKADHLKAEIEAPMVSSWGAMAAVLERIDSTPAVNYPASAISPSQSLFWFLVFGEVVSRY